MEKVLSFRTMPCTLKRAQPTVLVDKQPIIRSLRQNSNRKQTCFSCKLVVLNKMHTVQPIRILWCAGKIFSSV